jgi:hypothetical protein
MNSAAEQLDDQYQVQTMGKQIHRTVRMHCLPTMKDMS